MIKKSVKSSDSKFFKTPSTKTRVAKDPLVSPVLNDETQFDTPTNKPNVPVNPNPAPKYPPRRNPSPPPMHEPGTPDPDNTPR